MTMLDFPTLAVVLVVCYAVYLAGYWVGYFQAARKWSERVERLEQTLLSDPRRTRATGAPVNPNPDPSRISKGKIRQGRKW